MTLIISPPQRVFLLFKACYERSGLNDTFHLKAQLYIKFRSSFTIAGALMLSVITETIDVSSANISLID